MAFRIIREDITRVKADAIVNTANPHPVIGGGTDTAIYEAAGKEQLLNARKVIGEIEPGEAIETPAFNLNAKYIIHTVTPIWRGGNNNEFDTLKNAYKNSMELAKKLHCKSIAFPLMATGSNGFPKDKALQIALSTIQEFLIDNEMKVILVVFDQKAFVLSGKLTNKIKAFSEFSRKLNNTQETLNKKIDASKNALEKMGSAGRVVANALQKLQGLTNSVSRNLVVLTKGIAAVSFALKALMKSTIILGAIQLLAEGIEWLTEKIKGFLQF